MWNDDWTIELGKKVVFSKEGSTLNRKSLKKPLKYLCAMKIHKYRFAQKHCLSTILGKTANIKFSWDSKIFIKNAN